MIQIILQGEADDIIGSLFLVSLANRCQYKNENIFLLKRADFPFGKNIIFYTDIDLLNLEYFM